MNSEERKNLLQDNLLRPLATKIGLGSEVRLRLLELIMSIEEQFASSSPPSYATATLATMPTVPPEPTTAQISSSSQTRHAVQAALLPSSLLTQPQ